MPTKAGPFSAEALRRMKATPTRLAMHEARTARSAVTRVSSSRMAIARVLSLSAPNIAAHANPMDVVAAPHQAMRALSSHATTKLAAPPTIAATTKLATRRRRAGTQASIG